MGTAARNARDLNTIARMLKGGASATALCIAALATPAFAQDAAGQGASDSQASASDSSTSHDIVVTGIRASLANAQNIKRNSDTVVDAITATDIGALPDRSVTEALQRVPGIAINRFAGSNDPDHFSAEGSGVTVRGLNFVRSEFNGRDAFSAGVGGQALNFADVPAELLGSVEIYKNSTAENIEGGLAGTVNLNTRKPFDNKGFHLAFDAEGNYGDFEKKWSPTGSLLVSDTWDTGIGKIGLLADLSYSELKYRSDGIQVTNFQTRDNTQAIAADSTATIVCRNPLPGDSDTTTLASGAACGAAGTPGADGYLDPAGTRYAPLGGQFRSQDFDRKRDGQAVAFQWQSNDGKTSLTAQFLRSHTELKWGEHTFESAPDLAEYDTYPLGCQFNTAGPGGTTRAQCPVGSTQNYTYDSTGLFQQGYITLPGGGYRGSPSTNSFVSYGGIQQSLSRRQVDENNTNKDWGLNLKAQPAEHLFLNIDADYTQSHHTQLDVSTFGSTFADEELDLTGNLPVVVPHKPNTLAANYTWSHPAPNPVLVGESDEQYFSDPRVQFWRAAMDHIEDSVGNEYAFKMDADRKFDSGFVTDVKFGARYADRRETVKYSTYNWGVLSETWAGSHPVAFADTPSSQYEQYNFPDFFRGQTSAPPSAFYYSGDLIGDYQGASQFLSSVNQQWVANGGSAGWVPAADRPGVVPGSGGYLPNEIQDVQQRNTDLYTQLNFKSDDVFGLRMSGNLGLRYVHTYVRSAGAVYITAQSIGVNTPYDQRCSGTAPSGAPPGAVIAQQGGICLLGEAGFNNLQAFAGVKTVTDINGVESVVPIPGAQNVTPNVATKADNQFLPSLNLKFELSRDLIARFAASRVMTLPDLASIRNSFSASYGSDNVVTFTLGNPYLKPATASQFDATLEWYFARVGSLTVDVFYKDIKNFFYANTVLRNFTQNNVTVPVEVRIADNYAGHGHIKGAEIAYQQTFDFLPGLLSGFGINASYTYLDSSGLPNSFLNSGAAANQGNFATVDGNLPLEQLSKHTVNVEGFYEKGPISLRVAYNWRSRFLLTAADVIFPYAPIFNAPAGYLDASAFINVTKNIKIGVQGVNLTNTVTKTEQAYTGDPSLLAPRSYFINDRRFSFILRGSF